MSLRSGPISCVLTAALVLGGSLAAGCAARPRAERVYLGDPPAATLVLPGEAILELDARRPLDDESLAAETWMFSRNDDRLGSPTAMMAIELLEVRHRDYQRTINGRPREFSTTFTTTIRRGVTY
jgi:hypothetical protein